MNDGAHEHLRALLPDYVLGALDESESGRVARHLATCPTCPRQLETMLEALALFGPAEEPRRAIRTGLLDRVGARAMNGVAGTGAPPRMVSLPPHREEPPVAPEDQPTPLPARPRWRATLRAALVATLAGLLLVSGLWNVILQRRLDRQDQVARLLANPQAAHALTDTELASGAAGVIYAAPDSGVALIVANRLPPLPPDRRYQVWLFAEDGSRQSGGLFAVDPDGNGQALVRAPALFATYWAIGISAEPAAGSPAPTSALALGGWIR